MLELAKIFTDSMVLQRNKPIRIFGKAEGEVEASINGAFAKTTAKDGEFLLELPSLKEGGPYELTITAGDEKITLTDILIGDVFVVSGQSNAEFPLLMDLRGIEEAETANYPDIRFYTFSRSMYKDEPYSAFHFETVDNVQKPWHACSSETSVHFSAIGYYVAKKLHKELNIPIGVVSANYGGVRIETYLPPEAFETDRFTPYKNVFEANKISDEEAEKLIPEYIEFNKTALYNEGVTQMDMVKEMGTEATTIKGYKVECKYFPWCKYSEGRPGMLWEKMISKLAPMSMTGFIWYQGEANIGDSDYALKFKEMAAYWRNAFKDDLPFYTVEIAPFTYPEVLETKTAYLRTEQWQATKVTDKCHIVTTQDLGDPYDIHPNREYEVAKRIANQILCYTYGKDILVESPTYESHEIKDGKVYITLANDDGFFGKDEGENMRIAGPDGEFKKAESKYEDGKLVVYSDEVPDPKVVRYCYTRYYNRGRYFNKAGLPLAPFATERIN